jgi:heptosyltransferase I
VGDERGAGLSDARAGLTPGLLSELRPRRVGIVLLTGIGDVVHGLPLALDVKRHAPDTEVVWIGEPAPAEVVRHHPAVDRVVVFRKGAGVRGIMDLRRELAPLRCEITLNCMRYVKGLFPTLLTRAPVRLGLPPDKTRDGVAFFATHTLAPGPWQHTQDLFLRFRGPLGIPPDDPVHWGIGFSPGEEAEARAWFAPLRRDPRPLVGVVLATANPAKDWPAERYPDLVDRLTVELGVRPVLVGGPTPREREAAALVRERARHPVLEGLGDSVRRMMWRVRGVDVLVSPDTGPLHLAHALETPVVGLFGHTNPARVGPWRRYRELVVDHYTEPGEAPDPAGYEPKRGRMAGITVDEVLTGVARALSS